MPASAPAPDATIQELYCCGISPDGVEIYGPASEAMAFNIARGITGIVELSITYPHEMAHLAALGAWGALTCYFVQQAFFFVPSKRRTRTK